MPRRRESVGKALRRALGEEVVIPKIEPRNPGVSQLMNERRLRIFQKIFNEPGTHLRELQRSLDIPLQSLRWHVSILKKSGFIESLSHGRKELLFSPISASGSVVFRVAVLRDARLSPYIEILSKGEKSVGDIVKLLGTYQQLVSATLKSLMELGFVEQIGEGPRKNYRLAPGMQEVEASVDMAEVRERLVTLLADQGLAPRVKSQTPRSLTIVVNRGTEDIELTFRLSY